MTGDLTGADLQEAVRRAGAAMATLEGELNAADGRLGDGDTGGMLARVLGAMAEVDLPADGDLGRGFMALAEAAATATGSSLGTLFAGGLMSFGRGTRGRESLPVADLAGLLGQARDAMLKRGRSALGDKTVIDALDAVSRSLDGVSDRRAAAVAARRSAADVLERFRDEPCRIGRARMFGDRSRGLDDPGMLAFARLVGALCPE